MVYIISSSPLSIQDKQKKKWEPPAPPPRVGRKQRKRDHASGLGAKIPTVTPNAKCKLRLLKLERVKDWLLMEEEFVANQEQQRPQEERNKEDRSKVWMLCVKGHVSQVLESVAVHALCQTQVDDLRGSPMSVGNLEEIIDEKYVHMMRIMADCTPAHHVQHCPSLTTPSTQPCHCIIICGT